MQILWPYSHYNYNEDAALSYLVGHDYDVEMALAQMMLDCQNLAKVLSAHDSHLLRVLRGNPRPDKDIEHQFHTLRLRKN